MSKHFRLENFKDVTVVTFLSSDTATEEVESLKELCYELITDKQKNFVLNMCMCSYIPSIMLGILASFNARVVQNGGRATFCCLTEHAKTVLGITKLDKIFLTYNTQKEALDSFSAK